MQEGHVRTCAESTNLDNVLVGTPADHPVRLGGHVLVDLIFVAELLGRQLLQTPAQHQLAEEPGQYGTASRNPAAVECCSWQAKMLRGTRRNAGMKSGLYQDGGCLFAKSRHKRCTLNYRYQTDPYTAPTELSPTRKGRRRTGVRAHLSSTSSSTK